MCLDSGAQRAPIHFAAPVDLNGGTPFQFQELDGIDGKESPVPLGSFKRGVRASFFGQFHGGGDGVIGNDFGASIGEFDRFLTCVADPQAIKRILKSHQT